jgi:hypothetical protein
MRPSGTITVSEIFESGVVGAHAQAPELWRHVCVPTRETCARRPTAARRCDGDDSQHPGDDDDEITEFRPRSHLRLALEKREAEIGESPPKVNENGRSLTANVGK